MSPRGGSIRTPEEKAEAREVERLRAAALDAAIEAARVEHRRLQAMRDALEAERYPGEPLTRRQIAMRKRWTPNRIANEARKAERKAALEKIEAERAERREAEKKAKAMREKMRAVAIARKAELERRKLESNCLTKTPEGLCLHGRRTASMGVECDGARGCPGFQPAEMPDDSIPCEIAPDNQTPLISNTIQLEEKS